MAFYNRNTQQRQACASLSREKWMLYVAAAAVEKWMLYVENWKWMLYVADRKWMLYVAERKWMLYVAADGKWMLYVAAVERWMLYVAEDPASAFVHCLPAAFYLKPLIVIN